jgi:C-terminal domain 7 of the ABC-three component (ABC-3C) systems
MHEQFSAADSALGYLYQCRVALVSALQRIRAAEDFTVALETLDDVVFEKDGQAPELLQTKHHLTRSANLTDASPDLWKSLRIWCEGLAANTIPVGTSFYLITTSQAGDGSAAHRLRVVDRDVATARERLHATAGTSTNRENKSAYAAFLALNEDQQHALLGAVFVVDSSPTIAELDDRLKAEVRWAAEKQHLDAFVSRLEGWWFRRAIQQLQAPVGSSIILSREIEAQMDDFREQFKHDALPIDEDILAATVDASGYRDRVFVQQLRLCDIGAQRVLRAVREYFRAFEQRSRWLREDLLLVGELDRYEKRLIEEWELVFERLKDDLGEETAEEAKIRTAKEVYRWVEESVFPIRANVTEPFVTRGSFQILADGLRVGWHPEFLDRLRHLLEPEAAS